MTAIITDKIKRSFLQQIFDEATGTKLGDSDNYFYISIGRSQEWDPDNNLDDPISPEVDEREERKFRYGAMSVKAVEAFSFVVPVKEWSASTQYAQYNDSQIGQPAISYYVRTVDNNVYVCIRNGKDAAGSVQLSTVKPDHTDTSLPIETDGYIWKYLYTISTADTNFFVTSNYMPVKVVDSAAATDPYFGQYTIQNAAVPGQIIGYRVKDGGSGYDSATTTFSIVGNGSGAAAHAKVNSLGQLAAVEVGDSSGRLDITGSMGSGYDYANVRIVSPTGTGADVVPVFAQDSGMGSDPRVDLRATAMMFHIKPENAVVDANNKATWPIGGQEYRQVALWRNPLDSAGEKFVGTSGIVSDRIRTQHPPIPSSYNFTANKRITGDSNINTWIDFIEDSTVWYHQDEFTGFTPFANSGNINVGPGDFSRVVDVAYVQPDIDRYSGDILFISNDDPVDRTSASTDDIKLVIQL